MPHEHGAHLGGVRTIEDVRQRCHVDEETGCWHLRTARGRKVDTTRTHRIWVHGLGSISVTRAVWELTHGCRVPKGKKAVRSCRSRDCVSPEHVVALTDGDHKRLMHSLGLFMVGKRAETFERTCRRAKLSEDDVRYILSSPWSAAKIAKAYGVRAETISKVRRGESYKHIERPAPPNPDDDVTKRLRRGKASTRAANSVWEFRGGHSIKAACT